MPNKTSIVGAAAELRWGYAVAATLGAWSVNGEPGAWTFDAEIVKSDSFRLAQRPLTVVTPNGWRWAVDSIAFGGNALTAIISPIEPSGS